MKKKFLILVFCIVLLISITGCGNNGEKKKGLSINSTEKSQGKNAIVCTQEKTGRTFGKDDEIVEVTREIEIKFIYDTNDEIDSLEVTGVYKYDSDKLSQEIIEEQINSNFDNYMENTNATHDIKYTDDKATVTILIDYAKLTSEEQEKLDLENRTMEEVLYINNKNREVYCYQDNDKEKVGTPSKIDGTYVDDRIDNEDSEYQRVMKFKDGKIEAYSLYDDGSRDDESEATYSYKKGIISITVTNNDGEAITDECEVKSNYKGYDLVIIQNGYEVFRGNKSE